MGRLLISVALLGGFCRVAFGQTSAASEITPGGKLRVGMIAITVLGGVADPVARFIAQKLSVAVEPVMYPKPDSYLQSFGKGEWDIAIVPRVLAPADKTDSSADFGSSASFTLPRRGVSRYRLGSAPSRLRWRARFSRWKAQRRHPCLDDGFRSALALYQRVDGEPQRTHRRGYPS
jgi:hypothetical protein